MAWLSSGLKSSGEIVDSRDDGDFGGVGFAWIAESVREDAEAFEAGD